MYDVTWGVEGMPQWDCVLWEQRKCSRLENVVGSMSPKTTVTPTGQVKLSKLQVTGSLAADRGEGAQTELGSPYCLDAED